MSNTVTDTVTNARVTGAPNPKPKYFFSPSNPIVTYVTRATATDWI